MLDALYAWLSRLPFWRALAAAFVVALLCNAGFVWRKKTVANDLLDGRRRGYTTEEAQALFERLAAKRKLTTYAWTEVTLDLAFPAAYGLLFALLLSRLYRPQEAWVLFFIVAGVAADLVENVSAATMALTFRGKVPALARLASEVTVMKWALLTLALLFILFGAVRKLLGHSS